VPASQRSIAGGARHPSLAEIDDSAGPGRGPRPV
jgi:hypothetical protein